MSLSLESGGLYVNGDLNTQHSLIVHGGAHITGNLIIGQAFTNRIDVGGNLMVAGNLTIFGNSTLHVAGDSHIDGTITTPDIRPYATPTNHSVGKLLRNVKRRLVTDVCGICLDCSNEVQWQKPKCCSHVFHRSCIREWIDETKRSGRKIHCPTCRTQIGH